MSQFNFKSAICTNRQQSERLLSLGLKKETADMCSVIDHVSDGGKWEEVDTIFSFTPDDWNFRESVTPRWSLHRLIEILSHTQYPYYVISKELPIYDALCERIEWLIKEGYNDNDDTE